MKIVSFNVAKAIKEAGYPQGDKNSGLTSVYPLEDHDDNYTPYTRIGKLTTNYQCQTFRMLTEIPFVVAPTYLDVWLWLWRKKNIHIDIDYDSYSEGAKSFDNKTLEEYIKDDPEEAIIATIEYLVENNLIK